MALIIQNMSEQLVVWEELAQVSSNDSSSIELPIFMRDVETLDGEELYPEYGGVSIKRTLKKIFSHLLSEMANYWHRLGGYCRP